MGSKYSILGFVYKYFPDVSTYEHYIDVCGGSGVVLLNKPQSNIETYNDINGRLVNFFRVLQKNPDELIHRLSLTLHSRQEYSDAWEDDLTDNIESARRFFVRLQQSLWAAGAQDEKKGWASSIRDSRKGLSEKTSKWLNSVDRLHEIAQRFMSVQIENRDFRQVMNVYDYDQAFFYFDGPYLQKTRSSTKYEFDFGGQDYVDLAYIVKRLSGKIAISHYSDESFDDLFVRQCGLDKITGPKRKNTRSSKDLYECLYVNY